MNTFATEWEGFRRSVLHDLDEETCLVAREVFYSGALAAFNLLVLADAPVSERLFAIRTLSRELTDFMSQRRDLVITARKPRDRPDLSELFNLPKRNPH